MKKDNISGIYKGPLDIIVCYHDHTSIVEVGEVRWVEVGEAVALHQESLGYQKFWSASLREVLKKIHKQEYSWPF